MNKKFIQFLCLTALMAGSTMHAMENPDRLGEKLHKAALEGNKKCVKKLLKKGAPVDVRSCYNWTPLIGAAARGHKDICRLLIDNGASIHAKSIGNRTPLMFAGYEGHTDVCTLLIDTMLQPILASRTSIITFLGIKKYRQETCLAIINRDVAQLMARQMRGLAIQLQRDLFAQINAIKNDEFKQKLLAYTRQQL